MADGRLTVPEPPDFVTGEDRDTCVLINRAERLDRAGASMSSAHRDLCRHTKRLLNEKYGRQVYMLDEVTV